MRGGEHPGRAVFFCRTLEKQTCKAWSTASGRLSGSDGPKGSNDGRVLYAAVAVEVAVAVVVVPLTAGGCGGSSPRGVDGEGGGLGAPS